MHRRRCGLTDGCRVCDHSVGALQWLQLFLLRCSFQTGVIQGPGAQEFQSILQSLRFAGRDREDGQGRATSIREFHERGIEFCDGFGLISVHLEKQDLWIPNIGVHDRETCIGIRPGCEDKTQEFQPTAVEAWTDPTDQVWFQRSQATSRLMLCVTVFAAILHEARWMLLLGCIRECLSGSCRRHPLIGGGGESGQTPEAGKVQVWMGLATAGVFRVEEAGCREISEIFPSSLPAMDSILERSPPPMTWIE